jgi:hypothetical protein
MQNLVHKQKQVSPPKKHAVSYKLKKKRASVIIRIKQWEALKGPT